ncbi:hypothetical protein HQQ80_13470 [Microbacteriaceae bacterium VKM Ac-2855]|nr:hypothetical protein [Microbacteriaceae bacterium VKM Ac-2855]
MDAAEAAQRGLTHFFGARAIGLHNSWPHGLRADVEFNYWWLAHAIDARVDGFERTGETAYLDAARRIYRALRIRNAGRLFNGYFDDMMWLGCALVRLGGALVSIGDHAGARCIDDADALWLHARDRGWNARHGGSLAWRTRQLDYKNAPANGPFAILGARLERIRPADRAEADRAEADRAEADRTETGRAETGRAAAARTETGRAVTDRAETDRAEADRIEYARAAFDWMHVRLRDDATGFVADGIGREGGSARDDWAFSYNHGVYIGAAVALHRLRPDPRLIAHATLTALDAVDRLAPDGVFVDQGAGDGALFSGIWYRYAAELLTTGEVESRADARLRTFIHSSVATLTRFGDTGGMLLAGPRWDRPAPAPTSLAAQLSAVLATEAAARLTSEPRAGGDRTS